MVTPDQQRAAADYLSDRYKVSQRRICRVLGRSRSVLRYRPSRRSNELPLTREIKRLARRHPRYGYRRIHALLVRGGWTVNIKRVWDRSLIRQRFRSFGVQRSGVLFPGASTRPFSSLSCSRQHDRLKGGASVLCLVPSAAMR